MNFLRRAAKIAAGLLASAGITLSSLTVGAAAAEKKPQLPDNSAVTFADSLGAGWNLGNTFDPSNCTWLTDEMDYETAWGSARITKNLINNVKNAGFTTIRIPVSWHNHVDENFTISDKWADRVQEVVDWSVDAGLKVIINVHHDVEKGYYFPTKDEYETSEKYITTVWKQISERYRDYGDSLIFEIINEPRVTETNYEWWFNINSPQDEVKESVDCINRLNQAALDTIRASGGNNKSRYVIVCGYDTSIDGIMVEGFALPKDSAKNKLILAVHIYTKNAGWYKSYLDKAYDKYVKNGVPVILDEYNIDVSNNKYDGKSAEYLGGFVKYARERGISAVIWDNANVSYQLFDRSTAKLTQKDIADAVVKNGSPSKPVLTIKAGDKSAKLSWTEVSGATKYRVYRMKNGKLTKVKDVKGLSITANGLKSGKSYSFAVRARVDGKWTAVKKSDIKTVKIK